MYKLAATFAITALVTTTAAHESPRYRAAVNIPDVPGYVTLKCDFHIHTVFSDGLVWPTVRSEEAWREGLDAIAITDHIEYQPHKADMVKNHNRAYELARSLGDDLKLMVIHGSEITRSMPPGHLNAIFLTNSTPLETREWRDAVGATHDQSAFIFWNHPGWDRQLTNGVMTWYPEHTELLDQGKLHGIEVVNGREYYPLAHRWAIEKKLAMLSNSDIHQPLNLDYRPHDGDLRPVTLVFAKGRSPEAIKEALFARRTAVYAANRLIGDEQFLRPIFEKSIALDRETVELKGRKSVLVQISNVSNVDYELELIEPTARFFVPKALKLFGGKTMLLELSPDSRANGSATSLRYRVVNVLIGPDQPLEVTLPLKVTSENGNSGK
jgi:3',5'-nucleoside bisphosphate phosphatase